MDTRLMYSFKSSIHNSEVQPVTSQWGGANACPERGIAICCGILRRARVILMGDLRSQCWEIEVPYSPLWNASLCWWLWPLLSVPSCYFKCDFLDLRVNPEALLKISQLHFFKGCITGLFFFFFIMLLLRWIVAGFSIALNYFYAFLYSLRIIFPWKYQRECGLVFKNSMSTVPGSIFAIMTSGTSH